MPDKRTIARVCEACGGNFLAAPGAVNRGHARFCNRACWRAHFGTREQRFWAKVDKVGPVIRPELGPCWIWTASLDGRGYGQFDGANGRMARAHRVAYELEHAVKLTPDQTVCHGCDNPLCVRPAHLSLGTQADNMADMRAKGRHFSPFRKSGKG